MAWTADRSKRTNGTFVFSLSVCRQARLLVIVDLVLAACRQALADMLRAAAGGVLKC
jgi:hypothetical protein